MAQRYKKAFYLSTPVGASIDEEALSNFCSDETPRILSRGLFLGCFSRFLHFICDVLVIPAFLKFRSK